MTAPEEQDWTAILTKARKRLARARANESAAKAEAARLAVEAIAAGVSERATAELLGINRMSLRVWLGKGPAA
jgi:DNA invertase Pin-like site-specific DNA recombinase